MIDLTLTEQCAIRGMDALGREMHARHADELRAHAARLVTMLSEIAVAHGLPNDALFNGWAIGGDGASIVPLDGTTPPEVEA